MMPSSFARRRPAASVGTSRFQVALQVIIAIAVLYAIGSFASQIGDGIKILQQRLTLASFCGYLLYSCATFLLMGGAWLATSGEPIKRLGLFAWARLVREASSDLLPFSQLGGIAIGAMTVSARGVSTARVYASFVADLLTELVSQVLFTGLGVAILLQTSDARRLEGLPATLTVLGVVALMALTGLLVSAPSMFSTAQRLALRVLPGSAGVMTDFADRLRTIYASRGRLAAALTLNFAAWTASALGAWLVMRSIDVDVSVWRIVALESLIFLLRSTAFMVPGGIGVQEAGYALLGPLIGLPLDAALALALVKRLRDLTIALPVLVVWQWIEVRGAFHRVSRPNA
jgi:putative membrane protein